MGIPGCCGIWDGYRMDKIQNRGYGMGSMGWVEYGQFEYGMDKIQNWGCGMDKGWTKYKTMDKG